MMSTNPSLERVMDGSEQPPAQNISELMERGRAADFTPPPEQAPVLPPTAPVTEPPETVLPPESPPVAVSPETPKPLTEIPELPLPAPESHFKELFEIGNAPDAANRATEIVRNIGWHDPVAFNNLSAGVYYANKEAIQKLAMSEMGMSSDRVQEFTAWKNASFPALPKALSFPEPPTPDQYGDQVVMLPSGREVNVATPEGAEAYDNAKFRHDLGLKEAERTAREQEAQQRVDADRAERFEQFCGDCYFGALESYLDGRQSLINSLVTPAIANLVEGDKTLGQMFQARVEVALSKHQELIGTGKKADETLQVIVRDTITRCQQAGYNAEQTKTACLERIKEQGGRMQKFADDQDKIIRREINVMKDDFLKNIVLRLNKAEIAAAATQPNLPPGTKTVESVSSPPSDLQRATSMEELMARARQRDVEAASIAR